MSRFVKLKTFLDTVYDDEDTSFALTFNGVTMYSSADVVFTMIANWYDWMVTLPDRDEFENLTFFKICWSRFVASNIKGLYSVYTTLITSTYDPLSNYDMTEQGADGQRLDKTKATTTPSGETINTVETYRTGLDSTGDGSLTDKNVGTTTFNQAKTETETEPTNSQSMSFNGQTLSGYNQAKEHFLKRSGNIGVTTSQQMAESEIELRKFDILYEFVKRFIGRHCFYAG